MHAARRRRGLAATTLSLAVTVLIAAVWVRGLFVRDEVSGSLVGRKCVVAVFPHHLGVMLSRPPDHSPTIVTLGLHQYPSQPRFWEPRLEEYASYRFVAIPFWLPLMFALVIPAWWLLHERRRRNAVRGLCLVCGYDLRASTDRCPECGELIRAEANSLT